MNWALFDEQFKYVGSFSGLEQMGVDNPTAATPHALAILSIDKSGYLYVNVSNETTNLAVLFDNLRVTHMR